MYNPWYDAMMLTLEASGVVMLRTMALAAGGPDALAETGRMIGEKIVANTSAANTLMAGGSVRSVIAGYRKVIDANTERLLTPADR